MHQAVVEYLERVKERFPEHFANAKVLELGSLDVNGSPRPFFSDCEYLGVDWRPGPCVDVVAFAHELTFPSESLDTVISTEMFEHDRFAKHSFLNALRMLKPNGLFVFTCANKKRAQHEVTSGLNGHYKGISKQELMSWLRLSGCKCRFEVESAGEDLRGWIKLEQPI